MGLRAFTFDGTSSSDFGMFITEASPYNAPERAVEMIEIPGRNGAYALDKGNFENVEQTYHVVVHGSNDADFREMMSDVRNWLCSKIGYCRLSDDYNPGEYRMATYKSGLETDSTFWNGTEFDVTFDCKPQRYLAIGEELTEIGAWGNTETVEGDIVTIDASSDTAVKSLVAEIVPIQSGSGTPSPTNVRPISGHTEVDVEHTGKNLAQFRDLDSTWSGITMRANGSSIAISGTPTANVSPWSGATVATYETMKNGPYPAGTYTLSCRGFEMQVVQDRIIAQAKYADGSSVSGVDNSRITPSTVGGSPNDKTFTATEPFKMDFWLNIQQGSVCDFTATIQLEKGSTATEHEPYTGQSYTTALGRTVYGGTLDVVSGLLTVDRVLFTLQGQFTGQSLSEGTNTVRGFYSNSLFADEIKPNNTTTNTLYCDKFETYAPDYIVSNDVMGISENKNQTTNGLWFRINKSLLSAYTWAGITEWFSNNPTQVCYLLKTPQTYQLTPQQVELLLGENHIFADSGNVTVEYGHNPTLLTNPTWFPSKPLLAVEGYGNIGFNKHEINIENVTLGEITLEESLQGDGSVSFYIDTSKVNIGDPVTLNINQFGFELLALTNGGYLESNSLTVNDSNNNFHTTYTIPTPYAWNPYIDFVTTVSTPINLTVGTNATITNTVSGVWTLNTNNTITYSFETVVLYYGTTNHKVVIRRQNFSATISGNDIKNAVSISGPLIKLNSATANSTVSALGNPTYIDCDIGECYMIKDDSPISLNQYIDLGSDLPTLPSGDTEVTYDNTITKVEVKPNWWKV